MIVTRRTIVLLYWAAFLAMLPAVAAPSYTGSAACKTCHPAIYARWRKTPMANVVRDPKIHPDAIIPDLSKPNPLVTLKRRISPSYMAACGNSDISQKEATTTMCYPLSGT